MTEDWGRRAARELDEAVGEILGLVAERSPEELSRRPEDGGWSADQILDHLAVTAALYLPRLEDGIERARQRGLRSSAPRWDPGWLSRRVLAMVGPEGARKLKAPRRFVPAPEPEAGVRARFEAIHARLVDLLRSAEGLDPGRARVRSPISPLIPMNLGLAYAVLTRHLRRHAGQLRRAMKEGREEEGV